jgi:methylase of polypeptide subunit release factors
VQRDYQVRSLSGIDVMYTPELDGGGAGYGQDYPRFVAEHLGPQRRIFEWCAGPGFIGFSLLGRGLCDTLCLADVNPDAVAACRRTIERNGLGDRVSVYLSDGFQEIPDTERWNLVVGNPPHSGTDRMIPEITRPPIVYQDPNWRIHRAFYENVSRFLAPRGNVVIQENFRYSCVEDFRETIEKNGLEIVDTPACGDTPRRYYYYLWSRLKGS